MLKQKQGICPEHKNVMAQKEGINHVLHLLLTIFSMGLWGIVWIVLAISSSGKPYRCTKCGSPVKTA